MKKILFGLILLCFTFSAIAQKQTVITMPNDAAAIVNTGTVKATAKLDQAARTVTIQSVVTKVSGTVGGKLVLWGSLDGVNYEKAATDTLILANQTTNLKVWKLDYNRYYYYRVIATGSGTMNATVANYIMPRKYEDE